MRTLGDLLPEEFIGIGMKRAPASRTAPPRLDGAGAFRVAEGGGRLVRLALRETRAQRFGEVVVLYGHYEAMRLSPGVRSASCGGRLTEMFVRRDGRWLRPGLAPRLHRRTHPNDARSNRVDDGAAAVSNVPGHTVTLHRQYRQTATAHYCVRDGKISPLTVVSTRPLRLNPLTKK